MFNLQKKWEFAEEFKNVEISKEMRDKIFIPLIEDLHIEGSFAVQLCNNYFKSSKNHFHLLGSIEKMLQNF